MVDIKYTWSPPSIKIPCFTPIERIRLAQATLTAAQIKYTSTFAVFGMTSDVALAEAEKLTKASART